MTDLAQRINTYLEAEFRRYFPDATSIDVINRPDDEAIDVRVRTDYGAYYNVVTDFTFECGSDDDWYIFTCEIGDGEGYSLTIPFPEWLGE